MELKYFSLKDRVTGTPTKAIGWDKEITTNDVHVIFHKEGPEIKKNTPITRTFKIRPKGDEVTEISKEAYDALDVSGESTLSKVKREVASVKAEVQSVQKETLLTDEKLLATVTAFAETLK